MGPITGAPLVLGQRNDSWSHRHSSFRKTPRYLSIDCIGCKEKTRSRLNMLDHLHHLGKKRENTLRQLTSSSGQASPYEWKRHLREGAVRRISDAQTQIRSRIWATFLGHDSHTCTAQRINHDPLIGNDTQSSLSLIYSNQWNRTKDLYISSSGDPHGSRVSPAPQPVLHSPAVEPLVR